MVITVTVQKTILIAYGTLSKPNELQRNGRVLVEANSSRVPDKTNRIPYDLSSTTMVGDKANICKIIALDDPHNTIAQQQLRKVTDDSCKEELQLSAARVRHGLIWRNPNYMAKDDRQQQDSQSNELYRHDPLGKRMAEEAEYNHHSTARKRAMVDVALA